MGRLFWRNSTFNSVVGSNHLKVYKQICGVVFYLLYICLYQEAGAACNMWARPVLCGDILGPFSLSSSQAKLQVEVAWPSPALLLLILNMQQGVCVRSLALASCQCWKGIHPLLSADGITHWTWVSPFPFWEQGKALEAYLVGDQTCLGSTHHLPWSKGLPSAEHHHQEF